MTIVEFTNRDDIAGYGCKTHGDQAGKYVPMAEFEQLRAQLAASEAEVERLREALQPFSFAAAHTMHTLPATVAIWNATANGETVAQITLGDLRKARKALGGE